MARRVVIKTSTDDGKLQGIGNAATLTRLLVGRTIAGVDLDPHDGSITFHTSVDAYLDNLVVVSDSADGPTITCFPASNRRR
jgi:hypothetical protein